MWLPPLRERPEDIGPLATQFCATFAAVTGRKGLRLAPEAIELLARQPWPGNVRQLQNFIERLSWLAEEPVITAAAVEHELHRQPPIPSPLAERGAVGEETPGRDSTALDFQVNEVERAALVSALQRDPNKSVAAKMLGISRRTLYYKLEKYGLLERRDPA